MHTLIKDQRFYSLLNNTLVKKENVPGNEHADQRGYVLANSGVLSLKMHSMVRGSSGMVKQIVIVTGYAHADQRINE